ncbi:MAG: hypothetical protein PWP57_968 [Candidatus Atribacteria bacterium]|nr:hypothetical protein [Candidatus Atribacteria bacterium]
MVDPVSMQNIVIRSPEVARIQKVEDNASTLSSYALAQEAQDESQKVEREVIPSPETDRYTKEENRKKKEEQDMMDLEKKEKKEKQLMVRGDKGNIIDVRV